MDPQPPLPLPPDAARDLIMRPLPDEVLAVSDRIDLKRCVPQAITESFLNNRLPEKTKGELRYRNYLFKDRPPAHSPTYVERQRAKKRLSCQQRRRLFRLDEDSELKYDTFKEINQMWTEYIGSVIEDMKSDSDQLNLVRADFHGAYVVVCASLNPALIGHKGFIVQETKNTFKLITQQDRLISKQSSMCAMLTRGSLCVSFTAVAKKGTVFAFAYDGVIYKVVGDYLQFTPHQRSRAKVKTRRPDDI